jgi:uncharacterized membrane protein
MRLTLLVHVLAGGVGLTCGYVALAAAKGRSLHRTIGLLFVIVMLTMAVTGLLISAIEGVAPMINIPTALLTFYLVVTGLTTVRRPVGWSRACDVAAMAMAAGIGVACVVLAVASIAKGGAQAGAAFPLILFGVVAFIASAGDRRRLRTADGLRGAPRLARHLWRMCFALFIASIAFYLGPGRVPAMFRIPVLLGSAVLVPIAAMSYWLWRLRVR